MKKQLSFLTLSAIALLAVASIFSSCNQTVDTSFDKEFTNVTFSVPAYPNTIDTTVASIVVTPNLEDFAKTSGFTLADIKSITVKSATISIKDTTTKFTPVTFDIIDRVTLLLYNPANNDKIYITDQAPTHNGATELACDVDKTADVAPFLKASEFYFQFGAKTNKGTDHVVPMALNVTFTIVATIKK
jgi:hypothetical protein